MLSSEFIDKIKSNASNVENARKDAELDSSVISYHDYGSSIVEKYKTLRTNLKTYFIKKQLKGELEESQKAKVLTVTSSVLGEGKTITAINLAVVLANDIGSSVLLIDCDLHRGMNGVNEFLKTPSSPGLSEVLAGNANLYDVIYPTKINDLYVMPCGEVPVNPSELLGSENMIKTIETLKKYGFSYILLDAPSILPYTDAGILGTVTDGVIFIVRSGKTQTNAIKKSLSLLKHAQADVIGFVMTHSNIYS
ncbi:MAG: capsular polysaccharide biosynthesis [uncultured bacterium]|nr:MAG: capsular polysaccharide biosynthesis [uncultured bacterium]